MFRAHQVDLHRDVVKWSELRLRCEAAKRALSAREDIRLAMPDAFSVRGKPQSIDVKLDRRWAEERWAPLFERAQVIVDEALRRAGWTHELVDRNASGPGEAGRKWTVAVLEVHSVRMRCMSCRS